jgi:hypothetical protein
MNDALRDLQAQRAHLLTEISRLGDLRPGSVTAIRGRCGKPVCHCHRPNDPGHGPHYRLTRKVDGKTISETFPTPAAQRKAEREVAEFHHFRELGQAFVEVNEKICGLRSVDEEDLSAREKKRPKRSSRRSGAK